MRERIKKKTKKLSFLNILYKNDPQIMTNIFPFIRLILKILWIIFEIYLIWLGWVWEVLSLQVCVLLSPAVSILNSGGQEGRSDRAFPLFA